MPPLGTFKDLSPLEAYQIFEFMRHEVVDDLQAQFLKQAVDEHELADIKRRRLVLQDRLAAIDLTMDLLLRISRK